MLVGHDVADAERARRVRAPAVERAARANRARVEAAAGDVDPVACVADADRRAAIDGVAGAELAGTLGSSSGEASARA